MKHQKSARRAKPVTRTGIPSRPVPPYRLTKPQIVALQSADRGGVFYADPRVGGRLMDAGFAKRIGYHEHGRYLRTEAGEAWLHELGHSSKPAVQP